MGRIVRTDRAQADLARIWAYAAEGGVTAADRLLERIRKATERLADFPEAGRAREELAEGLRGFPVGDYVLFYRTLPDGVELIRVLHGAQDIPSYFGGPS